MIWSLEHEGNTAMLDYMEKEGIDVRKHMVEFMQYEPHLIGRGIEIDLNAESNVKGLFAAGDLTGNFRADIGGAATFGWIAGENAAIRAKKIKKFQKAENSVVVKTRRRIYSAFADRKSGATWQEANMALQQIMRDYAGVEVRSETLLKAGLKYLDDLKHHILQELTADNAHSLMRCLEVLDLLENGEAIFHTALERKETRAMHIRSDFPFTNPLLTEKYLTIRKEKNKPILEWRDKQ
jgi:succinate dehydrogenase/fumarate reductase flavoprotein subunit